MSIINSFNVLQLLAQLNAQAGNTSGQNNKGKSGSSKTGVGNTPTFVPTGKSSSSSQNVSFLDDIFSGKTGFNSGQHQMSTLNRRLEDVQRSNGGLGDIPGVKEVEAFIGGIFKGVKNSLEGMADVVTDLPGTLNTLWQVVSNPGETLNALKQELENTWKEFKDAPPERKAEMLGELVGSAVTEILVGKGAGKAASILAKTKTGAALLNKTKGLKAAAGAKIADMFSDNAAKLAKERFNRRLTTQVNSGIPLDALGDLGIIAGNKIAKGAVKFADFSRQMIQEFGENVRPQVEKLYREAMQKLGRQVNEAEIRGTNVNQIARRPTITAGNVGSVVVPGVRGGEFASWFNSLSKGEMDVLWQNKALRETIENRLRHPGGFHEWLPVSRAPKFREWGVKAEDVWNLRNQTKDVTFINPPGKHGGIGSTRAHNEILEIVDSSRNYGEFKQRLQEWAARRLQNGVADLPEGLRR